MSHAIIAPSSARAEVASTLNYPDRSHQGGDVSNNSIYQETYDARNDLRGHVRGGDGDNVELQGSVPINELEEEDEEEEQSVDENEYEAETDDDDPVVRYRRSVAVGVYGKTVATVRRRLANEDRLR